MTSQNGSLNPVARVSGFGSGLLVVLVALLIGLLISSHDGAGLQPVIM